MLIMLQDVISFLIVLLSSFCAGRKITRQFPSLTHWLDDMLVSFGAGFGIVSFIMLLLGSLGWFYVPVLAFVLLLILVLNVGELRDFYERMNAHLSQEKLSTLNTMEKFLVFIFLLAALVCFLICFAPSLVWDELHYHLPVPALYLKAHRIVWLPYLPYSNFPQLMEMLFLPALALGSASSTNLVHSFFALLTQLCVYRLASFFCSRQAGLFALMSFLFIPVAFALSPTAYVDFGFSFYGMLAFYLLVRGAAEGNRPLLLLSSVFIGLSFCTKYSGIFFYVISVAYLLYQRARLKPFLLSLRFIAAYAVIPVFFLLPYLLKNLLLTGNPVYPFLFHVFGGKGLTAEESKNIVESIAGFGGMGKTMKDLLLLPWNMTLHGERFFGAPGFLFLACLPACAAMGISPSRAHARVRPFLFFSVMYAVLWFHGTQQTRFLLPSLACLSVAIGFVFDRWMREKSVFFVFAFPFLLAHCVLGSAAFYHFKDIPTRLAVGAGLASREDYLRSSLESYDAFQFANAHLTQKDKVYLVNDNRGYYLEIPAIPSSGAFMLSYENALPDKERYRTLKAHGVTHLIFNGVLCFLPGQSAVCSKVGEDEKKGYFKQVYQNNGVFVLKVIYENVTRKENEAM